LVDINTVLGYNQEEAAGTGMVLTSNGEVLTNNHVIDGATSLSATDVNNGKTYKAIVVGYDRTQDIAVLQLENASGLKTVTVGDSSGLSTGEAVVGIGNAGGTGGTPSYAGGSITALNQSITASDEGSGTSEQLTGLIGSNANIEPGDSGGPLVDAQGRVIGMDTAASSSSGYEGISFQFQGSSNTQAFSIPIKEALTVAGEIEAHTTSSVVHIGATPFLGIEVESASDADSASIGGNGYGGNGYGGNGYGGNGYGGNGYGGNGYGGNGYGGQAGSTPTSGALIAGLISGTPAASAGLSDGDTITSLGGHAVTSADSLSQAMAREKPGESVNVIYVDQDGQSHTALVRLASGPPQ
jgi:S1-C subfamily serine protease